VVDWKLPEPGATKSPEPNATKSNLTEVVRPKYLNKQPAFFLASFPEDKGELIRLLTLSKPEIAFVRQHRGDHNRFGIAVLMSYLRYPGRILAKDEKPYDPVLDLVAEQLQIPTAAWDLYADRDETRREHLVELHTLLGMKQFSTRHYRALSEWLVPTALQTTRGIVLAQAVLEELRKRLIVLPPVAVIERLCGEAATQAQRKLFTHLTEDMSPEQKTQLDGLLEMREGSPYSALAWLRLPPGAPTARAVLAHIERFRAIRELRISPEAGRRVHQNRLLQLAREASQTVVYHLKEYEPDRRYGTLVALMVETAATLTDEILDLNDRLIGSFFTKAKNKYERAFAEQGKAINDKVRLYAKVGAALVAAREQGRDPYSAIEAIVSWDAFSRSVTEAKQLARDEDFDALSLVTEHYPQLRRFAPVLLETFEFRPAAVARELVDAVDVLRTMNREPELDPRAFSRCSESG
jgi:TnpA family transposase